MWFKVVIYLLIFFSYNSTPARPISYVGGWTLMQKNDYNQNSFHLHYSPSVNYSIGYRAEYWRTDHWQFHGAQLNYLLKRINKPKSQTNLYLRNGLGLSYSDNMELENKIEPSIFSGIAFDWENRRFYTSYENRVHFSPKIHSFYNQKAKIGLAPYVGEYGDLHTWLLFQIEHMPKSDAKQLILTPLIRIFKGDILGEFGYSNSGDFILNFIKRF